MQLSIFDDVSKPASVYSPDDLMSTGIPFHGVEAILEQLLQDEIAEFEILDIKAVPETNPNVKWKYSSSLQKSLRRGFIEDAVRYALTYNSVDSAGFWARLPIIAFEDVGLANPLGVALTLAAARSKSLRAKIGGDDRCIQFLIKALTEGTKDRTVADMYQVLENRSLPPDALKVLQSATAQELIKITLSDQHPYNLRIAALWLLWGTDKMKNGRLPLRMGDRELFEYTVGQMQIPGLIRYIIQRGMIACKCGMNVTYGFVWQMMKQSSYVKVIETKLPERFLVGGLIEQSWDKHTRQGKIAYQNFYRSCPVVNDFLTGVGIVGNDEVVAAIGISVFISESALLDRRVDFEGAEQIYQMTVEDDYRKSGLTLVEGLELSRMILENTDILRRSRQTVVASTKS